MNMGIGVISDWNEQKAFGFITPNSSAKSIFFHINDYSYFHKRPVKNLEVQYLTSTDPKGRICAINVVPLKGHKNNGRELKQKIFSLILFSGFAGVQFFLFKYRYIPLELVCLYAVMSIIAFIIYAKDKSAAKLGTWRTTESTLHMLSLLGGWPGASLAQSFLRHKSKKISFRVTYWITVIANCGGLYWLLTPKGSLWLKIIIKRLYILLNQLLHEGLSNLL